MKNNKHFVPIILLLAGILAAQTPRPPALLMALNSNSKQMAAYEWKQKTTILRKGSPVGVKIDLVRFDAGGEMQRIPLMQPEEKKMGPLRAMKAAEVKDNIQEVMQLAGQYVHPRGLSQAIRNGEIWEGPGSIRVRAKSILLPMDEMSMLASSATYLPTRIEFRTIHDGRPVVITADYRQMPGGPAVMSHLTVQIPSEDALVHVESYDFARSGNTSQLTY